MNTKRQYKFASMTHAYQAFDSVVKENSDLLAMLERVTGFLNDPNGDEFGANALDADIRALLSKVKGE